MVARRYNEADIDFGAIDADLAKLAPPKLGLKDVLDRLRERMLEQRAKGVTVAQMHEVLKARGVEIGERSLKAFLDKGELPGRKAAKAAEQSAAGGCGRRPVLSAFLRLRECEVGRGGERPARARKRRAWREARAGVPWQGGDRSASGGGAKRHAAKRGSGHGAKRGPILAVARTGPCGKRCAAIMRRRCRRECRAGAPCRRGSR